MLRGWWTGLVQEAVTVRGPMLSDSSAAADAIAVATEGSVIADGANDIHNLSLGPHPRGLLPQVCCLSARVRAAGLCMSVCRALCKYVSSAAHGAMRRLLTQQPASLKPRHCLPSTSPSKMWTFRQMEALKAPLKLRRLDLSPRQRSRPRDLA